MAPKRFEGGKAATTEEPSVGGGLAGKEIIGKWKHL